MHSFIFWLIVYNLKTIINLIVIMKNKIRQKEFKIQQKKELDEKYQKMTKNIANSYTIDPNEKVKKPEKKDKTDLYYRDPDTGIVNRDFQYKLPDYEDDSKKMFVSKLEIPNQKKTRKQSINDSPRKELNYQPSLVKITADNFFEYATRIYEGERFAKSEEEKLVSFCFENYSSFRSKATKKEMHALSKLIKEIITGK